MGFIFRRPDLTIVRKDQASIFPYNIEIRPPEDESHLVNWKRIWRLSRFRITETPSSMYFHQMMEIWIGLVVDTKTKICKRIQHGFPPIKYLHQVMSGIQTYGLTK